MPEQSRCERGRLSCAFEDEDGASFRTVLGNIAIIRPKELVEPRRTGVPTAFDVVQLLDELTQREANRAFGNNAA